MRDQRIGRGERCNAPEDVRQEPGPYPATTRPRRSRGLMPIDLVGDEKQGRCSRPGTVGDRAPRPGVNARKTRGREKEARSIAGYESANDVLNPVASAIHQGPHDEDPLTDAECDREEGGVPPFPTRRSTGRTRSTSSTRTGARKRVAREIEDVGHGRNRRIAMPERGRRGLKMTSPTVEREQARAGEQVTTPRRATDDGLRVPAMTATAGACADQGRRGAIGRDCPRAGRSTARWLRGPRRDTPARAA